MRYSSRESRNLAQQIFDRFGPAIDAAAAGSHVPADFLAGFVGVEAGKDKKGQIVPAATRFEPQVYARLRDVRDGKRAVWSGITRKDLAEALDLRLRELATSHGPAQIMGWHTIHDLRRSIGELSDPATMFICAVELLEIVGGAFLRRGDWPAVMRIWNTGRPGGKTFDDDYVANALDVKTAYKKIVQGLATTDPVKDPHNTAETPSNPGPERPETAADAETAAGTQNDGAQDDLSLSDLAGNATAALDKVQGTVETIGAPIVVAEKISTTLGQRVDAVKSTRATLGGLLWQAFWAVFGFLIGLPWYAWIAVLVLGGLITLAYIFRQTLLGYVREKKA